MALANLQTLPQPALNPSPIRKRPARRQNCRTAKELCSILLSEPGIKGGACFVQSDFSQFFALSESFLPTSITRRHRRHRCRASTIGRCQPVGPRHARAAGPPPRLVRLRGIKRGPLGRRPRPPRRTCLASQFKTD